MLRKELLTILNHGKVVRKKEETVENRKFCDKRLKNNGDNKVHMKRHHVNVEELNCN